MASSRLIKEEMLDIVAPEIYKRKRPKRERGAPYTVKQEEKALVKAERKIKRASKKRALSGVNVPLPADGFEDDEPVIEFVSAPRRPYQWKGRRVRRVLRPGVAVSFTPGVRSSARAAKRLYDEVYGDEDILEAAEAHEGEFAYGKRLRDAPQAELLPAMAIPEPAYVVLDESNPTPGYKPITEQKVILSRKRGVGKVEPTIQVLASKKRRMAENEDDRGTGNIAEVQMRDIKPVTAALGIQTVDVSMPDHSTPMQVVETLSRAARTAQRLTEQHITKPAGSVKVEAVEMMHPSVLDITPMDVKPPAVLPTPTTRSIGVQTDPLPTVALTQRQPRVYRATRRTSRGLMPYYRLHPSITPTPGYRGSVYVGSTGRRPALRRRRRRRQRRQVSRLNAAAAAALLPGVRYHPSIMQAPTVTRLRRHTLL
ncbi:pV [Deer mastadenovirus B]|uniref:PV n=1 Tax=Deer mastadenovirus B TaxID=2170000 RepID=A0A1Y0B6G7_9ADEN|nr:pV [Deer mastadenovirus B]ART33369.1 pV [Deer mastadenovirus B]